MQMRGQFQPGKGEFYLSKDVSLIKFYGNLLDFNRGNVIILLNHNTTKFYIWRRFLV